ncbi:MAG TPA: hypothetical protein VKX31_04280 [Brumimicrobium sp.]|nr:hypothetical protein [Brumimicrobium sp.]
MKNFFLITLSLSFAFLLTSCSNQTTNDEKQEITPAYLKAEVERMDDSLKGIFDNVMENPNFQVDRKVYLKAIEVNLNFYESFPEDPFAETALNKIASLYFQLNLDQEALKWRGIILEKYPEAKNRTELLELQMSHYSTDEFFSQEMIEHYAHELLKTENLSETKKEEYEFRLKHSDKNFSQLIEHQILNSGEN